jgi:hypothetical protein
MKEKSKKCLGAIIPALLLCSPAFASSARSISRVRSKNLAVQSETADVDNNQGVTINDDDPFEVFGGCTGPAVIAGSETGNDALTFLKSNDLLHATGEVTSKVSGELDSVVGRKDFAAQACSMWGSIWSSYTQAACISYGGTWVTIPPTIQSSSISNITSGGFRLNVDISHPGTVYAVVVARNGSAPSSAQVKAGQDGTGAAAVSSSSVVLNSGAYSGLINFTVANADQNLYNVYFVAEDVDGMTATPAAHNVLTETVYSKGTLYTYSIGTWSNVDIEIDDSNNIYTFYQSSTVDTYQISKWNGSSWGSYTTLSKDPSFSGMMAERADMVVDGAGDLHVLTNAGTDQNDDSGDMYYNKYHAGNWSGFVKVYDGNNGIPSDISSPDFAFADSSNKIHLSYNVSGILYYSTNASGSWATTSLGAVSTGHNEGRWTVAESNGTGHVVYEESNVQDISTKNSSDSFAAKTILFDTSDYISAGNVVIDDANKMHLVYSNTTQGKAYYKTNASGSWVQEQLTSPGFTNLQAIYIKFYGTVPYVLMYNASEQLFFFKRKVDGVWEDGKFFQAKGANAFIIDPSTDKIFIPFEADSDLLHVYYYALPIADLFSAAVTNTAPTLGGSFTTAGAVNDNATIAPFNGVTVADTDGDNVSVAITYTAANGTLTGTGLTGLAGSYTLTSAAPATVTSNLQGLVFHPTANQVVPVNTVVTSFTLTPNDGTVNGTANNTTQVTATSINDAPTVGGATAVTNINDNATAAPFSTFTIADADTAQTQSVSVTLDTAAKGSFTTLNGFTNAGGGVYTFSGTAAAAQTAIRGLVFTPTANRITPGSTETTTFTVSVNDGIAAAATDATTTVVSTSINDAPVNSVVPAISGTSTVGSLLSATSGTWTDVDPGASLSYSYQWYRADDSGGTGEAAISGATSNGYTLTTSDAHKFLRVVVTANDGQGSSDQTATSARTAVTDSAPVNSAVPTISGTSTVGSLLSASSGTWTDADGDTLTYFYQWYRANDSGGTGEAAISGATSSSYTLTTNDAHKFLRVIVTANDGHGSSDQTATSARTAVTNTAPVNSAVPTISGTSTVGSLLSASSGTWTDADGDIPTYTYQWYRADDNSGTNEAIISGAISDTYTPATNDAHKYLRVVVTANDGHGSSSQTATSTWTALTNSAPVNTVAPVISGTSSVGSQLTATSGTWTDGDGDAPTYTYQWYRADDNSGTGEEAIPSAISNTYTLTVSDTHKYLRVVVTANDGHGSSNQTATSAWTNAANTAPVNTVVPVVSGTSTVGSLLTATSGTWTDADGDVPTYSYQWYRADDDSGTNDATISGATNNTYTLTADDTHKYLRIVVTANDGHGSNDQTATSTRMAVSNAAPVNTGVPVISGTNTVGSTLSATAGTWTDSDGDSPTYSYQWYRANDNSGTNETAISGATAASYTLTTSDAHKYLRVIVTANDGHGSNDQTATSTRTAVSNTAPVNSVVPVISGTNKVGSTLSVTSGTWTDADGDIPTFTYQWKAGASVIDGQISSTCLLTAAQSKENITCTITADDGYGGKAIITTAEVTVANSAPVFTGTPAITGKAKVGNTLALADTGTTDADGDAVALSYQWAAGGIDIPGATLETYLLTINEDKKKITCTLTADDGNSGVTPYTTLGVNVKSGFPWWILMPGLVAPKETP